MTDNLTFAWQHNQAQERLQKTKLQLLKEGRRVIDLGMINPDLEPARFLIDRLQEAVSKKLAHRYSVAKGVLKLREALAQRYADKFNVELDPEKNISICAGAKDALVQALMVTAGAADYLLLPTPTYPSFLASSILFNKKVKFYELADDEAQTLENIKLQIEANKKTILILNFPNNPTGKTVKKTFYQDLAVFCEQVGTENITVINDFAYGEIVFDRSSLLSMLSVEYFKQHGLEIYTMSKSFSIPGWRVGAVVGDQQKIAEISQLKSQTDFGLFLPVQWAAAAALIASEDFAEQVSSIYYERYILAATMLRERGFTFSEVDAGCSIWLNLPKTLDKTSADFTFELLKKVGVLLMPGEVFGEQYNQCVRLGLVSSKSDLELALSFL